MDFGAADGTTDYAPPHLLHLYPRPPNAEEINLTRAGRLRAKPSH